jgi:hypothetical protein
MVLEVLEDIRKSGVFDVQPIFPASLLPREEQKFLAIIGYKRVQSFAHTKSHTAIFQAD